MTTACFLWKMSYLQFFYFDSCFINSTARFHWFQYILWDINNVVFLCHILHRTSKIKRTNFISITHRWNHILKTNFYENYRQDIYIYICFYLNVERLQYSFNALRTFIEEYFDAAASGNLPHILYWRRNCDLSIIL